MNLNIYYYLVCILVCQSLRDVPIFPLCFFLWMSLPLSYSQTPIFCSISFSGSTYFGDLAPDNKTGSFSKFHLGMGFLIEILDHVSVSFNYDHATLSGDDKKSDVLERRIRNLSFISPIV